MQGIYALNSFKKIVFVLALSISIGFATAFIANEVDGKFILYALFLLIIFAVIFLGFLFSYRTKGYLDILSPYVYFPLMYLVVYGVGPHKAITLNEEKGYQVLLIIFGGFLMYLMGALFVSSILIKREQNSKNIKKLQKEETLVQVKRRYTKIKKLSFYIGVVAMVAFWAKAKGIPALMPDLENSRVVALEGNGIPYYFSMSIMVSVWIYFMQDVKIKKQAIYLIIGVALLMSTGWRNTSVALICVAIILYHYRKPIPFKKLVITGVTLVFVITVSGLFRIYSSDLQGYELMTMMESGNYIGAFFSYLYSYPVVFTDNLILVIDGFSISKQFLHGASLVWNFFLLIPGYDVQAFDFVLKDYLGRGFAGGGLPPTLLGDLYLNFGYIGILIGMIIVGALNSFLHHKFMNNRNNLVGLASIIALYYLSVSIRGGLENITLITTWLLILVLALSKMSKYKIKIG
ncbi:oligosaccharide repeat unit polymerase [Bacillus sp. AG236]|nr:oligosaccharide repeat unit polymerase [Bacillus sp. AG236]